MFSYQSHDEQISGQHVRVVEHNSVATVVDGVRGGDVAVGRPGFWPGLGARRRYFSANSANLCERMHMLATIVRTVHSQPCGWTRYGGAVHL